VLELREVTKRYRSGPEVVTPVASVSLTIRSGELVALYGPSGSGKTTLLLLAAGIERPDSGAVFFERRDLRELTGRERVQHLRRDLGFIWQSWQLQPGLSALDNAATKLIAEGMRPRDARRRALPLLELVGLGGRANHRPDQLSTGERQRVSIARALANGPRLVLADEPTGNLDSERSRTVLAVLADACAARGASVLLATHDPQAAEYANRLLTLADGRVEEQPPPAQHRAVVVDDGAEV
jgi:putative ABC transport system ATP-binding protein